MARQPNQKLTSNARAVRPGVHHICGFSAPGPPAFRRSRPYPISIFTPLMNNTWRSLRSGSETLSHPMVLSFRELATRETRTTPSEQFEVITGRTTTQRLPRLQAVRSMPSCTWHTAPSNRPRGKMIIHHQCECGVWY